jgi:hypothetical protein
MKINWSHCRSILITGNSIKTRIEIPLYDIAGDFTGVRRVGNNLIMEFVQNPKKLTPPGLETPVIKKNAVKARDPSSIRQTNPVPN